MTGLASRFWCRRGQRLAETGGLAREDQSQIRKNTAISPNEANGAKGATKPTVPDLLNEYCGHIQRANDVAAVADHCGQSGATEIILVIQPLTAQYHRGWVCTLAILSKA